MSGGSKYDAVIMPMPCHGGHSLSRSAGRQASAHSEGWEDHFLLAAGDTVSPNDTPDIALIPEIGREAGPASHELEMIMGGAAPEPGWAITGRPST